MIDLNTYEEVKLEDVAEYARAKKGKVYPVGTSTIQISATRGQIGYVTEPRDIETKHSGLNIQEKDVGKFPIQLHNSETQDAIAKAFGYTEIQEQIAQQEIDSLKELKNTLLNKMMC